MKRINNLTASMLLAFVISVVGCEPYQPPTPGGSAAATSQMQAPLQVSATPPAAVFAPSETEFIVMIVIDLSGSFAHHMADDGKAYEFALRIYDRYFRDRIGNSKDELILAQLSGTHRSLLWRGSPIELRHKFATAEDFKEFLLANANPNGSVIHDGIAHALEYMNSDPALTNNNAKSAVFVLSDLLDNGLNPEQSGPRVSKALAEYASKNGVVGMYYVDQELVLPWRQTLQAARLPDFRVDCNIDDNPDLPSF